MIAASEAQINTFNMTARAVSFRLTKKIPYNRL